jgi:hypothetical protein
VQDALLVIFRELSYFSWFTPITNMGASAEGAEVMTLGFTLQVNPILLYGTEDTSGVHNVLNTNIIR